MFCTSLRQRRPMLSLVPHLQEFGLKESRLTTHDAIIPINSSPSIAGREGARSLQCLFLSPEDLDTAVVDASISRFRHFASLTGGKDVVVCFVLAIGAPDKQKNRSGQSDPPGPHGIHAYNELQCKIAEETDVHHVPILLCTTTSEVVCTIKTHIDSISFKRPAPAVQRHHDLLSGCTTVPPLDSYHANLVSDYFGSMHDLVNACVLIDRSEHGDPPVALTLEDSDLLSSMSALRDQIGGEASRNIFLFWTGRRR